MKLCSSCGKQNIDRAKFCGYCGSALHEPQTPPVPQDWRTDETIKASPTFFQEMEKKNPSPQTPPGSMLPPTPGRVRPVFPWRVAMLFIVIAGLFSAGWLLLKPSAPAPAAPPISLAALNPFQGTATPTPSITPTPTLTPTPTATASQTPTQSPTATLLPVGIGVRRQDVESIFTDLGFAFHEVDPVLNQPRWIGRSIDRTCSLELLGEPKEITRAILIIGPSDVGDQELVGRSYLTRFLTIFAPDWTESGTWLQAGLRKLNDDSENDPLVSTTVGNRVIALSARKNLGLTILSVEGARAAP